MTFFIRKALSFLGGLLRLNLSKSGPGVSVGLKGLRVGVKPDGRAYVAGGRGGLYFRESIKAASASSETRLAAPAGPLSPTGPVLEGSSLRRKGALSPVQTSDDPLAADAVRLIENGPTFSTKSDLISFLRQSLPGGVDGRIGFSRAWLLADFLILKAVHTPGQPLCAKLDAVFAREAVAAAESRRVLGEKESDWR